MRQVLSLIAAIAIIGGVETCHKAQQCHAPSLEAQYGPTALIVVPTQITNAAVCWPKEGPNGSVFMVCNPLPQAKTVLIQADR